LQPNKATATGSLLAAGFCCAVRCGGHRAALRPDMEKAPCKSLCAALFRWGEKKMEKEKERMHKTLGGGAVTRRRS